MEQNHDILGLDIGGTNIRAGLIDEQFTLRNFTMESSTAMLSAGETGLQALGDFIAAYCDRHLQGELPKAVSIGFPSTLNREKTVVLSTPNLPGFNDVPVTELLQKRFSFPVLINRDVNMIVLHDMHENRLEDDGIVIGCYIGTGLGNAIVIGGEILAGRNGVAGELGHVPVWRRTDKCGCGNTGCMETLASGRYLEEVNEKYFPGEPVSGIFVNHADHPAIRDFLEGAAIPIVTEINIFDPDYVVLGGGVLHMRGFPRQLLQENIVQMTRKPYPASNLRFVWSSGKQESGVIGAGMYAHRELQKRRKS